MILVVDDHVDTCQALLRLLRAVALVGRCADSGEEALSLLDAVRPDAIILDYHLPGMSGLDVLRHLKSGPRTGHIPVIMYSAYPDPEAMADARRLGAVDWLTKGVQGWSAVLSRVKSALAGGDRSN